MMYLLEISSALGLEFGLGLGLGLGLRVIVRCKSPRGKNVADHTLAR